MWGLNWQRQLRVQSATFASIFKCVIGILLADIRYRYVRAGSETTGKHMDFEVCLHRVCAISTCQYLSWEHVLDMYSANVSLSNLQCGPQASAQGFAPCVS